MATHGRFLTTHVGSLPRPDDLKEMMWAREDGAPVDTAALDERVRNAVDEAVAKQTKAGIDIVNDGEWGKPSYATYIKDRLHGFGGTATTTYVFQDIEALPQTKGAWRPTRDANTARRPRATRRSACATWRRRARMPIG